VRVCGVDYSTRAIDLVSLDFDADDPKWRRIDITGWDRGALPAALRVRSRAHLSMFLEDVSTLWIEQPFSFGRVGTAYALGLIAGAFLASLPKTFIEESAISQIGAPEWRKALVGNGRATKEEVRYFLRDEGYKLSDDVPLDAWEALGIALVARKQILYTIASLRPA
jgi:Holliday junction resolvasome RuvABC endonuclease subunit